MAAQRNKLGNFVDKINEEDFSGLCRDIQEIISERITTRVVQEIGKLREGATE